MNQQLSNLVLRSQPTVADHPVTRSLPPLCESLIAKIQSDGRLPEGTKLSPSSRQQMVELADRLSMIMADKRPEDETKTLAILLSAFPRQGISAGVSDMMIEAYGMAMEECPTWAIEEAVRRWITGKCGDKHWAPSPPELRCAADEVILLARGRAAVLRTLAKAEVAAPPTPEALDRARQFAEMIKARPIPQDEGAS